MSKTETPDIVELRRSLGRTYLDDFEGVTLAVFLASELETGDGKELSETGWEVEALAKMELLLDLIHQHYAPTIAQAVSRAEKAEAELAKHQWRTIESAPDNVTVIVCGFGYAGYFVATAQRRNGHWYQFDHMLDGFDAECAAPTHWQPLPSPPGENDG